MALLSAITLIETVGSASANTYVTAEEATNYMFTRPNAEEWEGASSLDPQIPLKMLYTAAQLMQRENWLGRRATSTQALAWPRYSVRKPDGWYGWFENDEIPQQVKDAQCEVALALLKDSQALDNSAAVASSSGGGFGFTAGPLRMDFNGASLSASASVSSVSSQAAALISDLIGGTVRRKRG